jgi:alanyl-tRNA synthetase
MTSNEVRAAFLEYFRDKDHEIVPGSPLIPANDPTLLFTNAGMVQFKELFLGNEVRSYTRATTTQRCIRAGGKHNDLDNVGYTARHHTFFEMLGNFSFGDYFKREAIEFAWEFLTVILEIPKEKLWITVYEDDDDAADIWLNSIGVSKDRFSRCGEADNFWAMGDTGPCGPCSEIFYDHGKEIPGGPPGSPDAEGDRYIEIWNLVFTQYDRAKDGTLTEIPKPSVDTGMGLERISAILQGVHNNYEIDIFKKIISSIQSLEGFKNSEDLTSQRVIADHIRSCAFLIADGIVPSNEGRGYVLRRIIRRAIRHGSKLGFSEPFFYQLVSSLADAMGDMGTVLLDQKEFIEKTLLAEEQRFAETLDLGLKHLEDAISSLKDKLIPGEVIFKLYDTYGFPVDLTSDIARERNLEMDLTGFEKEMDAQRNRARAASKFDMDMSAGDTNIEYSSDFIGYENLEAESEVIAILHNGNSVDSISQGDKAGIILTETPFYAESGGQVGDTGKLFSDDANFSVSDTQKIGGAHVHTGILEHGEVKVGQLLRAEVDLELRQNIVRNHSATHLLHAALRQVLGNHVSQKGSLVEEARLRFDFSHPDGLTTEELIQIEDLVNEKILENTRANTEIMALEEAKKSGAMSLFGEKYGDTVRVLKMGGEFSVELCGGTHVNLAGDIGLFKIITETGIAAGVRRIEALTGNAAISYVRANEAKIHTLAGLLKSDQANIETKLGQVLDKLKTQEKEISRLKSTLASKAGGDLASEAIDVDGIKVLAKSLDDIDQKSLRDTLDQLKNKLGTAAIVLASVSGNKITLVAGVTKDTTNKIKAGELVNFVAEQVGGHGGGRPDMAQAGGNDPAGLPGALEGVPGWIKQQLN